MNNEFKKINENNITRYVLEDGSSGGATAGGTGVGSGSTVVMPMGSVRRRAGDDLIHQENKKSYKISHKPKNPVAKAHQTVGTGSGQHKDKTKVLPRQEKHKKPASATMENFDGGGEYNDEVGMIRNDLHTIVRCTAELNKMLDENENIAEWVQEKIAVAKSMMVTVLDYVASEHEMGHEYSVDEEHNINPGYGSGSYDTYAGTRHGRGMAEGEGNEAYVACIVDFNRSGQAMVRRSKPVDKAKAEEIIANAKAKNTFVHPPFMTIYPASAGKLDGETIMKQFPDMSQQGISEKITVVNDPEKATGVQTTSGITHGSVYAGRPMPQSLQQKLDGKPNTGRAVDAKGRTQQEWMALVKSKFPTARVACAKMIDGPCFAILPSGKKISWTKVDKGVAEGADSYMESLASTLAEKLDPNAEPEVWVQDFQKANPNKYHQFKNKTPQKKAQMAVAARRDARLKK